MSENMFLAAFFFPSVAAVLIFFLKYTSDVLQARVRLGQDAAYREIAAKVAVSGAETAASLAEIRLVLMTIEKILKAVE